MDINELNHAEVGFIEIIRAFKFLFSNGYSGKEFSMGGREPGVCFESWIANRQITVYWSEGGYLDVCIKRKKIFRSLKYRTFSIRDYYKYFNCESLKTDPPIGAFNILKTNADVIQQYLMPVIKGEMWIDELLKQRQPAYQKS